MKSRICMLHYQHSLRQSVLAMILLILVVDD